MASIYSIVYQPEGQEYRDRRSDYLRVPVELAHLVAGHGIQGDQKAGRHPNRQLNILSLEWLQALDEQGWKTQPGQFGEQLILAGIDVRSLAPGARLQLGPEAVIEITKSRTGCDRFEAAQGKKIGDLGALGVLAKVITGGLIQVGDLVSVLEAAPSPPAA